MNHKNHGATPESLINAIANGICEFDPHTDYRMAEIIQLHIRDFLAQKCMDLENEQRSNILQDFFFDLFPRIHQEDLTPIMKLILDPLKPAEPYTEESERFKVLGEDDLKVTHSAEWHSAECKCALCLAMDNS
jgi:hypothetical protein